MPAVISNTSPIQYLFQAELLHLLPQLFGVVNVPEAVLAELLAGRERNVPLPDPETLPWLKVCPVQQRALLPLVTRLGDGEKEVLALGKEMPDALLLLDDREARRHAEVLSLEVTGTLGILLLAKEQRRIEAILPILDRLEALQFRLHPATRRSVLGIAQEAD